MKCQECQIKDVERAFADFHATERQRNITVGSAVITVAAFMVGFMLGALIF